MNSLVWNAAVDYGREYATNYAKEYIARRYRNRMPYLRGSMRRSYAGGSSAMATKQDVFRLYRQVRANKPEMKHMTSTLSSTPQAAGTIISDHMTDIDQGTNIFNRTGSHIKVWGYEIRGRIADNNTGLHMPGIFVLRSRSDNAPTLGDIIGNNGAFIESQRYAELQHYQPSTIMVGSVKMTKRFKKPIFVKYTGTVGATFVRNPIFVIVHNPTGGNAQNVSLTMRVWFTDA